MIENLIKLLIMDLMLKNLIKKEKKKIKRKNALNRCLGLYSYGLELQKNMKLNKENSELQREKKKTRIISLNKL